ITLCLQRLALTCMGPAGSGCARPGKEPPAFESQDRPPMDQPRSARAAPRVDARDDELLALLGTPECREAAREALVSHYTRWVRHLIARRAKRLALSPAEVEDAQQEGALALLRAIDRYQVSPADVAPSRRFRAFLRRIVLDRLSDYMRWRRR